MFTSILVGVDAQTRGSDAIALARGLASANAAITLAHIYPPSISGANITGQGSVDAVAASALLDSVAAEAEVPVRTRCADSVSVSDGLHAIAEQIDADLLVIGTTNRNRLSRSLLGNFTADALATSDCTVAIAPQGYAAHPREFHRVGVAYDGSVPSEAALSLAHDLAETLHADLSALKVVSAHDRPVPRPHRLERAVRALKAGRDQIQAHEGVEARVACGDPVAELGGYSNSVDLLVAGARGAGFLARLFHPSTTEALSDVVSCPLLVVTRGAREREQEAALAVSTPA